MASILDKYGIKEVADVTFYHLNASGQPDYPVLYLDTLKVSTIEQAAEQVDARGGKGNPRLITWDYNKDITVTLEDALFSAKSMAVMFGDGNAAAATATVKKTIGFTFEAGATQVENAGHKFTLASAASIYNTSGATVATAELSAGNYYFGIWNVTDESAMTININSDTFPGTYYITGDTFARAEINGEDEFFQFVIPKAKVSAENTITLEAEGDPSVFNLNLTVLKQRGKPLMQLIKYNVA